MTDEELLKWMKGIDEKLNLLIQRLVTGEPRPVPAPKDTDS